MGKGLGAPCGGDGAVEMAAAGAPHGVGHVRADCKVPVDTGQVRVAQVHVG